MRKDLKISKAKSMENGIKFYSIKHKGYFSITKINDKGDIISEWQNNDKETKNKKEEMKNFIKLLIFSFPVVIVSILLLMWGDKLSIIHQSGICYLIISILSIYISFEIYFLGKTKENRWKKFHSAEHMILNAYRKLGKIPSIDELRKFSRFSNSCSSNVQIQIPLTCFMLFIESFIPNYICMRIAMDLSIIVVLILIITGHLNYMQYFTTEIPTDE